MNMYMIHALHKKSCNDDQHSLSQFNHTLFAITPNAISTHAIRLTSTKQKRNRNVEI